jgi:hypothetical protein
MHHLRNSAEDVEVACLLIGLAERCVHLFNDYFVTGEVLFAPESDGV